MPVLLALAIAFGMARPADAPDVRQVLRNAIVNLEKNDRVADHYNYKQRRVVRHLDGNGAVKKTEVHTFDVVQIEGTPWKRLIAKDDKPLPPNEERKEEERLQKETRKRASESAGDRQKRLREHEKERQIEAELNREALEAFDFRLEGREAVSGVACFVISAAPRPGFKPKRREAGIMKHLAGRIWITETTNDIAKFEANVMDDVSFGWFLAKLRKGGRIQFEQTRVNDEVWLPRALSAHVGARALIKQINMDVQASYYDYKKFRVESKITAIGEQQ
jgi:hypothetical protein